MTRRPFDSAVNAIDRMFADRLRQGLGPGLSLAVTTRDGLVATRTYGLANADRGDPVTDETLFQIGSITKHITATACLRLAEQGRLDIQAPVTRYVDWFRVGSRFATPITLHHILTHTAGLVMMMDSYPSSWAQVWMLRETDLGFEPGSGFSYSNVGYNVLQCVIQTVTNLRFDEALRELVFAPLGMSDTWGEILPDLYPRLADGHTYSSINDRPVPRPAKQVVVNRYAMSQGCASVVTTAAGLAKYLRMQLRGGRAEDGTEFLSAKSIETMLFPHAPLEGFFEGTTQGYGAIVEQSDATRGHRRIVGGGENLGFEATMYGDLDAGVGVIVFCNSFDIPWSETRWALDALVAAAGGEELPKPPALKPLVPAAPGERAKDYVGTFCSAEREFAISDEDGNLRLTSCGQTGVLEPVGGDRFVVPLPGFDHGLLSFSRDAEGRVVQATHVENIYTRGGKAPRTKAVPVPEWLPYVGPYRSFAVLVTDFRIFPRAGQLWCQMYGGYGEQPLTDLGGGRFRLGDENSPETLAFDWIAGEKALRCRRSGCDFYRVDE
ncbi:MAG: serine hydrolase domain-containing protein [Candidatus Bipolaricaulia bacterium]